MSPVDPTAVADRLAVGGTAGLIAGLVFAIFAIVIGFQTGFIVQGWIYKEEKARSLSFQELTEKQGEKLDKLTTIGEAQQIKQDRQAEKLDRLTLMGETNAARSAENSQKLDRLIAVSEARRTAR